MNPKARFIKSVIDTAANNQAEMPWTRGKRRASFISSRRVDVPARRLKIA